MFNRSIVFSAVAIVALALSALDASAQGESRFGQWKIQSDAPPPSSNIMTYEAWGDGGMKITVASVNSQGQEGSETAVEVIDERSTRIINRRNGQVTQVIINSLSEDGNTISNEYVRLDADGKITRVTHAVYERIR